MKFGGKMKTPENGVYMEIKSNRKQFRISLKMS